MLALGLREAGIPLAGFWTRREAGAIEASTEAGVACSHGALPEAIAGARTLILAVRDEVVPLIAGALLDAGLLRGGPILLHCGGARPAREALAPAAGQLAVGTLHPLLAVVDARRAVSALRAGAVIAVEGDPEAREIATSLALALGADPVELPSEGIALYHLAATVASNHLVALLAIASDLLGEIGLPPARARAALLPLLRSTLENLEAGRDLASSLTGPIRRGDGATLDRHLELLARRPSRTALYRAASLELVRLLRAAGLEGEAGALDRLESRLGG
jgi:predicted short-subunit dehydrogenase-like oxidoreductase (DUF2520 family)